jgi:valyl-tRNA synthetase
VAAEAEYELLVDVSRGLRSLTAEYSFKEDASTYILPLNDAAHNTLQAQTSLPSIQSLADKTVSEVKIPSP